MSDEIQLISDGDGIAVIGEPAAVERFLSSAQVPSRDLGLPRLSQVSRAGSAAAEAAGTLSQAGRWVKLSGKSAELLKSAPMMKGSEQNLFRAIAMQNGKTANILEIVRGPGTMLANPALLAGAAGIMAQVAMQQAMDEITDYLAIIDEKVDDVLRAQKDAVLADMIGVDLVIEEAMTVREHVGRVSEVTWLKVNTTAMTIARTQAYALRQLDAIAEKIEGEAGLGDLAKRVKTSEPKVQEWLAVIARCFQLQDGLAVLELDRVLAAEPEELDRHRVGLHAARRNRLDLIARTTARLLERMDSAAARANAKVLLQPFDARSIVQGTNKVGAAVVGFRDVLGIEGDREALEGRRWRDAASDARTRVVQTGSAGVGVVRSFSVGTADRARSAGGRLAGGVADRIHRRRGAGAEAEEPE